MYEDDVKSSDTQNEERNLVNFIRSFLIQEVLKGDKKKWEKMYTEFQEQNTQG